jgi:hypothetical protein
MMTRFLLIPIVVMILGYNYMMECNAFTTVQKHTSKHSSLHQAKFPSRDMNLLETRTTDDVLKSSDITTSTNVRHWFQHTVMAAAVVMVCTFITVLPQSASASYSAYAHREEDWQQRISDNAIQVTNPKKLRAQLREIAPMNEERSRIFCPNGPSAAVTPLMENRCSDVRQATPSVFGRTDDVVGNSIPGFNKDYLAASSSIYSSSMADPGGLPEYGFTKTSRK